LERAILVGVEWSGGHSQLRLDDSLDELARLSESVGAQVVGRLTQRLARPNSRYLGKGKLEELKALRDGLKCSLVIFDDELSPSQQRNLEEALQLGAPDVKVLDRSALILDIFSRHARTREGSCQVNLAQHEYLLPRLAGQWSHLERLGGGIGTRGPGETQLETDRRLIRGRIQRLKSELLQIRRSRSQQRNHRRVKGMPVIALVGYTNAGKSTLFNALTGAGVRSEDRPFSTLDPVTRQITLPSGNHALITDTVGFIQKLPATLIAAFRATLEELTEADLLLHIVDINHPNAAEQAEVVDNTLKELHLQEKPRLLVFNKTDLLIDDDQLGEDDSRGILDDTAWERDTPAAIVSATLRWGITELRRQIERSLDATNSHKLPD
jgi:GTP-binding protein HflX